ncbi:hypothetical protein ACIBP6_03665 [Nonomuraea terrae]|uniref:hypothetical protein n=1 Tax=Nonomuraea terrae TaxID=2530383 RepID=UPI0037A7C7B5
MRSCQPGEIVQRVGRLRTNIGNVATLDDAVAAFNPTERIGGRRSSAFAREDLAHLSTKMTSQSEKYVDGPAFTSVDDMRRSEYDYRHGPRAI